MSMTENKRPVAVVGTRRGGIADMPQLVAAGRSGNALYPLDQASLIPLPTGSKLLQLPNRAAIAFHETRGPVRVGEHATAVAAFLPPGYVALSLAAFDRDSTTTALPLYCYCTVCWHNGGFHVPAIRVDRDTKHDSCFFDIKKLEVKVRRRLKKQPGNRLLAHHGNVCALQYHCPNAANLFLGRWEAPIAVSGGCNAGCRACISKQTSGVDSPQQRIDFTPTISEILEIAVPHLQTAPKAIVSFGQGCEGEPLLRGKLIETAIREIRKQTHRGIIHLNTNGSAPEILKRLVNAGLDSVRISLNSAREPLYSAYYRPRGYSFNDVLKSLRVAKAGGLWVSMNYLTFPGVTDAVPEVAAFFGLLEDLKPDMIQWRNLNIDPDLYMKTVQKAYPDDDSGFIGLPELMRRIRKKFPALRMGYFNPHGTWLSGKRKDS